MKPELQYLIETEILPMYEAHDSAHRREHVDTVIRNSMEFCADYPADPDMVYAIAAYHDVGIRYGRKDHHLTGARFLREDERLSAFFSPEQVEEMAQAIEDHRASGKDEPRSLYGKIISDADRSIDPEDIVSRCMSYGKEHYPELDEETQCERTREHIRDKYGEGGYMRLWLHSSRNEQGLAALRELLHEPEKLRAMCGKYF